MSCIDATGTPTTHFSLPTYDTANDAPSGQGFNCFAAAVDTALFTRAPLPSTPTGVNQALGWDGSNFTVENVSPGTSLAVAIALGS